MCMQLRILHLRMKHECWVSLLTHFRINFLGIYWGLFGARWSHLGDPWGCFDWYRVHLKKIWIENKSNRVRTIDAFSCVLVLQILLVIFFTQCFVLLLLKCSFNWLTFTFHALTYLYFAQNRHFFMILTRLWPTDGPTDQRTDGPTAGHTLL